MEVQELEMTVPWGHIAIKAWGDPTQEAIICLPGLGDNAGTFDTLIPILPRNFYYICVDLPGHGLSSNFPYNHPLEFTAYLFPILLVIDHFKKERYILMGHSFGGRVGILFAQMYPELIAKIIALDSSYTMPIPPEEYIYSLKQGFEKVKKMLLFKLEDSPTYSYAEVIDKLINSRVIGTLTPETAQQLAKRMIKKICDDKYVFTGDKRLWSMVYPSFSEEYIDEIFLKFPIKCPAMSIYASSTVEYLETFPRFHKLYRFPNFDFFQIDGHHHSHHTNPELYAPILTNFLLKQKAKL
ncbi:monoacylglycerol lipase [Holotrichia oblita]|uniref:Monoacylglycerol lipase n=1 Tax=Holotrichia oblita TaxID=644536 RepID=A0ACB9TFH9_HOLOL|nr:monoacylglycerol lipase [Holotrichia oblita]